MTPDNTARGLILGTAKGYQWEQVANFVLAWKRHAAHRPLVLLVDHTLSAASRRELLAAGVTLRMLPRLLTERNPLARRILVSFHLAALHRWLAARVPPPGQARPSDVLRWRRLAAEFHHIGCARFSHYLHFLQEAGESVRHVLLTDVRDVVLQGDPLADAPEDGLVCALETNRVTLLTQVTNARWLDFAYGRERWRSFAHQRVSCAGTTLGTLPAIRKYLTCLAAEIIRLTPRLVGQDGLDQAIHNYLLNTGRLPAARLAENGAGPFATLHGEDPGIFARDARGRLLNRDGRPVPLVHQFDRHPALAASLIPALLEADRAPAVPATPS